MDIDNTIRSINVDLPSMEDLHALNDIRSQIPHGVADDTFPEDPVRQLFTDECQVRALDTLLLKDGNIDPVAPKPTPSAQIDSGANANSTNQASLLLNIHKLDRPKPMADAGSHPHTAYYRGYLVIPIADGTYRATATYYTPSIPMTIITPNAICRQFPSVKSWQIDCDIDKLQGNFTFRNKSKDTIFSIPFTTHNNLQWTPPVIRPTYEQKHHRIPNHIICTITTVPYFEDHKYFDDDDIDISHFLSSHFDSPITDDTVSEDHLQDSDETSHIHQLALKTQSQLFHQRLGHINFCSVSNLHHHVDGIP